MIFTRELEQVAESKCYFLVDLVLLVMKLLLTTSANLVQLLVMFFFFLPVIKSLLSQNIKS